MGKLNEGCGLKGEEFAIIDAATAQEKEDYQPIISPARRP